MATAELSFHDALLQQSASCSQLGSPIYAEIFRAMAKDLIDNGVTARISENLTIRPQRDAAPLRIAGAIHRLALTGKAPNISRHFPSTGGAPGPTLIHYAGKLRTKKHAQPSRCLQLGFSNLSTNAHYK